VSRLSDLSRSASRNSTVKRKWERIANRGFDKANGQSDSVPHATAISGQGSGAMLEGIKEGVQGVSRFIAAGLGEISSPSAPSSSRGHVASQSNSSISTYATKSTRFSQSSTSSFGDDCHSAPGSPLKEDDLVQILMVHDTGATPTMSPNFTFVHQQQQQQEKKAQQENAHFDVRTGSGAEISVRSDRVVKLQRTVSPSRTSPLSISQPSPNSQVPTDSANMKQKNKIYGNVSAGLPPASSIPGLGSLAVGIGANAPSWVGSVGRKWEELQKGSTFSKSQKRASVLLSDVSQTIVSALSSPPSASSCNPSPSTGNGLKPQSSPSWLDDENPSDGASVMKPDVSIHSISEGSSSPQDFDDEWNW